MPNAERIEHAFSSHRIPIAWTKKDFGYSGMTVFFKKATPTELKGKEPQSTYSASVEYIAHQAVHLCNLLTASNNGSSSDWIKNNPQDAFDTTWQDLHFPNFAADMKAATF